MNDSRNYRADHQLVSVLQLFEQGGQQSDVITGLVTDDLDAVSPYTSPGQ